MMNICIRIISSTVLKFGSTHTHFSFRPEVNEKLTTYNSIIREMLTSVLPEVHAKPFSFFIIFELRLEEEKKLHC